jgi:hypothetical protein
MMILRAHFAVNVLSRVYSDEKSEGKEKKNVGPAYSDENLHHGS